MAVEIPNPENAAEKVKGRKNQDILVCLRSIVDDLIALKATQDAIISAADDAARNAVTPTVLGTSNEA